MFIDITPINAFMFQCIFLTDYILNWFRKYKWIKNILQSINICHPSLVYCKIVKTLRYRYIIVVFTIYLAVPMLTQVAYCPILGRLSVVSKTTLTIWQFVCKNEVPSLSSSIRNKYWHEFTCHEAKLNTVI